MKLILLICALAISLISLTGCGDQGATKEELDAKLQKQLEWAAEKQKTDRIATHKAINESFGLDVNGKPLVVKGEK